MSLDDALHFASLKAEQKAQETEQKAKEEQQKKALEEQKKPTGFEKEDPSEANRRWVNKN